MGGVEGLRAALADRYAVEREVGHGAMATVYLAHDLQFDRDVAVKVLSPDLSAALGAERFLREIDVVARLNHPHILPLLDSGNAGGFLYYVMPYVDGSLRNRLTRETQLRIDEAITLTREIALALDYAHQEGIVHRDVKPENILLSRGFALLADFGIARVLSPAEVERLTNTGASPGTPAYMSPEQCGGGGSLDGRSDLYSLGCVLYELLAGAPPFTGPTAQAIAARQLTDPVPPLRTVRRTVSEELERVVLQVLEKVPADRYATGAEFATALAAPSLSVPRPWWRRLSMWKAAAALTAVGLGAYVAVAALPRFWSGLGAAGLDSTRYAILPFERDSGLASFNEDQLLQDAMVQWSGISVVDRPRMLEALPGSRARLTSSDAEAIARRVGAGRYVVSQVSRVGDSLRIHSAVYRTNARAPPIHESTAKVGLDRTQTNPAFSQIAERLLFGGGGPGASLDQPGGTTSRPARQAFELGLDSIYGWNLTAADSAFRVATEYDPGYAQAHLWLAQVRFWSDTVTATWRSSAERAFAGRTRLAYRDRPLSDALLAFSRGDLVRACAAWQELTVREPYDFSGWYGLATCLSQDEAVLPDSRSPSRWRFRSSYYRATKAYERAFQLLPSIHRAFSAGSYAAVRRLLKTDGSTTRRGSLVGPDTMSFVAQPSWLGDTLAFVPFPQRSVSETVAVPLNISLAVRHQRELFRDIATAWVTAFPRSTEALEALAISYDMLEDPAAIARIRQARALASSDNQRVRLAVTEVWMRVKTAVPSDTEGLVIARALIDSLLPSVATPSTVQPLLLASLAALTGRAQLAAALAGSPAAAADFDVPPLLAQAALPLLVFASFGGPSDSLRDLEQQVDAAIDNRFLPSTRQEARMRWLVRPARLAFPDYQFTSIPKLVTTGDYLIGAEAALLRRDTAAVLRVFTQARAARRAFPPSDVSLEAVFPEARLLTAIGDPQAAIEWLDGRIRALPATDPQSFVNPANATALVRAMALRADLAQQVGDRATARRWAGVVALLWSDSDPFLQAFLRRMRQMAGTT
jgi:tRNA A-37 threonylcarbamoyl transferase component Bud32/tetratricopeptide (TPR) repeat protein